MGNYVHSISSVSSDPILVCTCESPVYDKPQCNKFNTTTSHIIDVSLSLKVYPGENFTVPVFLVGMDYGTTTGVVYSNIKSVTYSDVKMDWNTEKGQVISNNKQCTILSYSLSSNVSTEKNFTMYISLTFPNYRKGFS